MKTKLKLGTAHRPVRAIGTLDTYNQRPVLNWAQPVSEEENLHNIAIEPEKRRQENVGASLGDFSGFADLVEQRDKQEAENPE